MYARPKERRAQCTSCKSWPQEVGYLWIEHVTNVYAIVWQGSMLHTLQD